MKRTALRRKGIIRGKPIRLRGYLPRPGYGSLRTQVWERDEGRCVCCGMGLGWGFECHHRRLRKQQGQDSLENCIALSSGCHAYWHSHPLEARLRGLIVPSWASPTETPVWWRSESWRLPGAVWHVGLPQPWQSEEVS